MKATEKDEKNEKEKEKEIMKARWKIISGEFHAQYESDDVSKLVEGYKIEGKNVAYDRVGFTNTYRLFVLKEKMNPEAWCGYCSLVHNKLQNHYSLYENDSMLHDYKSNFLDDCGYNFFVDVYVLMGLKTKSSYIDLEKFEGKKFALIFCRKCGFGLVFLLYINRLKLISSMPSFIPSSGRFSIDEFLKSLKNTNDFLELVQRPNEEVVEVVVSAGKTKYAWGKDYHPAL